MIKIIRIAGFLFTVGLLGLIGKVGWELVQNNGELLATLDKDLDQKRKSSVLYKPPFNTDQDEFKISRQSLSDSGLDGINRVAFFPKVNPCQIRWLIEFSSFKRGKIYSLTYESGESCGFEKTQLEYIHMAAMDQINRFIDFKKVSHVDLTSIRSLPIDYADPDALGAFLIKLFKRDVKEETWPGETRRFKLIQN
jgi:hypothetical protein